MLSKPWVRQLALVGLIIAGLVLLILIHQVLVPIFIALALAYIFDPVIDRFELWKIPRTWGIVILCCIILLVFGGFLLYVVPRLVHQLNELQDRLPLYWDRLRDQLLPQVEAFRQEHAQEYQQGLDWLVEQGKKNGAALLASISMGVAASFKSLGSLIAKLVGLVVVPVMTFYLLRDFDKLKLQAVELVPLKRRESVIGFFSELDGALSGFIKGQLTVAIILSIIYSIGLFICGCPAPLLIGVIAGFANLVPYLGLALGLLPAVLLTYLSGNGWGFTLGAGLTFVVGQMLEGLVITPKVVGESVGLHPVVVMLALMVGGTYFGLVGMILALPSAAVLVVILKRLYGSYTRSVLFHEEFPAKPEIKKGKKS
ncbi:MAG: AI-2E family transporter [Acidobacteria bacterium]|nr:AI-2E family transporter [Acidobacteriota bacterium]MCB9398952.1 AI-2E family transporter [Acidobacteriota bacterium]